MEKLRCKRCEHIWIRRLETLPKKCPHCASPYWNKERKNDRGRIQQIDSFINGEGRKVPQV